MPAPPPLPGPLAHLGPVLRHGYLAVGGLVLLEDFGIPVPGETILIAAALYAGAGRLNIAVVALVALVAAITGDNIGYAVGRLGGRRLVLRFGRYVLLTEQRLTTAEGFFARHGGKVVAVARFVEGLRQANGIVAGLTRMPWPRFVAFNALGAALWVALWSCTGYFAGSHVTAIYHAVGNISLLLAALAVLALLVAWRRHRHRRGDGGRPEQVRA